MNKIIAVIATVLTGVTAFGTPNWATVNTEAYSGDSTKSAAGTSSYQCYLCTVAAAQTLTGSSGAVDVDSVTAYMMNNFAQGSKWLVDGASGENLGAKMANGVTALDAVEWSRGQYSFTTYFSDAAGNLANELYFGILLYSAGGEDAVRVFSAESDGVTWLADDSTGSRQVGTAGDWTKAVPEPTSGLLMLLGVAGLALRRNRNQG